VLLIELTTQTLVDRRGLWRLPQAPEECPAAVQALIVDCIQQDPAARPSAADALSLLRSAGNSGE